MAKYVKLGDKAESFYDPTTKTKVLKNQVVKLEGKGKFSKKITAALAGGHLVNCTEEDYKDFLSDSGAEAQVASTQKDWKEEFDISDEKALSALTKAQLVELAKYHETETEDSELNSMNKKELVEEVLSLVDEDEEDED